MLHILRHFFNSVYRRVHRTPGCTILAHEPKSIPASNLASHLRKCPKIPQAENWEATQARNQQKNAPTTFVTPMHSLGAHFASQDPNPAPPPTILSSTLFRSTLIQGITRDSFSLTFGEGEGMKQVFLLVNSLVKLPSHQTLRRDLDKLYAILLGRVILVMQVRNIIAF